MWMKITDHQLVVHLTDVVNLSFFSPLNVNNSGHLKIISSANKEYTVGNFNNKQEARIVLEKVGDLISKGHLYINLDAIINKISETKEEE